MKTTNFLPIAFTLLCLTACEASVPDDVIDVSGEVSARFSGDGMPVDQPEHQFELDSMWLDLDDMGRLSGFQAHSWGLEPGKRSYDLDLSFAPATRKGEREILAARVCYVTCPNPLEGNACEGPCFDHVQNARLTVHDVSADGKSFDLSFSFDVANESGRVIHVEGGEAVTDD